MLERWLRARWKVRIFLGLASAAATFYLTIDLANHHKAGGWVYASAAVLFVNSHFRDG